MRCVGKSKVNYRVYRVVIRIFFSFVFSHLVCPGNETVEFRSCFFYRIKSTQYVYAFLKRQSNRETTDTAVSPNAGR